MSGSGLPVLRMLLMLAILAALFLIPALSIWHDERRKRMAAIQGPDQGGDAGQV
jgi:hypothetical protein